MCARMSTLTRSASTRIRSCYIRLVAVESAPRLAARNILSMECEATCATPSSTPLRVTLLRPCPLPLLFPVDSKLGHMSSKPYSNKEPESVATSMALPLSRNPMTLQYCEDVFLRAFGIFIRSGSKRIACLVAAHVGSVQRSVWAGHLAVRQWHER